MKKIIMALSVAAATMALASSCSDNGAAKGSDAFIDSISEVSGTLNGAGFSDNIVTLPEADQKKFDKEQFLRGLKEIYLTDTANMSYILGIQIGLNMLQQQRQMDQYGVGTNRNLFYKAFAEAFKSDSIPEAQKKQLQEQFQALQQKASLIMSQKQQEQQAAAMKAMEEENTANMTKGKAYVDSVKAKDKAVQTTESGLSYKVDKAGEGAKVTDSDRVIVKYTGRLINGKVFDSNDKAEFSPREVVPGFSEGLKMMSKGSKMTLYIPGNLGYGPRGAGGEIAPGATLVFDVEVLDVLPGKKEK